MTTQTGESLRQAREEQGRSLDDLAGELGVAPEGLAAIERAELSGAGVAHAYRGRPAGSLGELGVLSFNGNKIVTTSGGGALVTDRVEWAERARFLATQACEPAPHYEHSDVGYSYRLSNLLAAVGSAQLEMLEDKLAARRATNIFYRKALDDLPGVEFMPEADYGEANCWPVGRRIGPATPLRSGSMTQGERRTVPTSRCSPTGTTSTTTTARSTRTTSTPPRPPD